VADLVETPAPPTHKRHHPTRRRSGHNKMVRGSKRCKKETADAAAIHARRGRKAPAA